MHFQCRLSSIKGHRLEAIALRLEAIAIGLEAIHKVPERSIKGHWQGPICAEQRVLRFGDLQRGVLQAIPIWSSSVNESLF